jgi:hypothetical protein
MRGKSFGMQLPGEILDSRHDPRRGPVHGIADDGKTTVADSF